MGQPTEIKPEIFIEEIKEWIELDFSTDPLEAQILTDFIDSIDDDASNSIALDEYKLACTSNASLLEGLNIDTLEKFNKELTRWYRTPPKIPSLEPSLPLPDEIEDLEETVVSIPEEPDSSEIDSFDFSDEELKKAERLLLIEEALQMSWGSALPANISDMMDDLYYVPGLSGPLVDELNKTELSCPALPTNRTQPWLVNFGDIPPALPHLRGRTILVIINPASQGGVNELNRPIIEKTFNKNKIGAALVEFMDTHPDSTLNNKHIKTKVLSMATSVPEGIVVVAVGGDGTLVPVKMALHELKMEGHENALYFEAYAKQGTAADKASGAGVPGRPSLIEKKLRRWFGLPPNITQLPKFIEKGTLVAEHTVELEVVMRDGRTLPISADHNTGMGADGFLFNQEEIARKIRTQAAEARLAAIREQERDLDRKNYDKMLNEATTEYNRARNKEVTDYFRQAGTTVRHYVGFKKGFNVTVTVTRADGTALNHTYRAAQVSILNSAVSGAVVGAPSASPTLGGKVALAIVPSHPFKAPGMILESLFKGIMTRYVGIDLLKSGSTLRLSPPNHYILLSPGDSFKITTTDPKQTMQANGDVIPGYVEIIRGKVTDETVRVMAAPGSLLERQQVWRGATNSRARRFISRNGAAILSSYPDSAGMLPLADRPTLLTYDASQRANEAIRYATEGGFSPEWAQGLEQVERSFANQSTFTPQQLQEVLTMTDAEFDRFSAHQVKEGNLTEAQSKALEDLRRVTAQEISMGISREQVEAYLNHPRSDKFRRSRVFQEFILKHRFLRTDSGFYTLAKATPTIISELLLLLGWDALLDIMGLTVEAHPVLRTAVFLPAIYFSGKGLHLLSERIYQGKPMNLSARMSGSLVSLRSWNSLKPGLSKFGRGMIMMSAAGNIAGEIGIASGLVDRGTKEEHRLEMGAGAALYTYTLAYEKQYLSRMGASRLQSQAIRMGVQGTPIVTSELLFVRQLSTSAFYVQIGGFANDALTKGIKKVLATPAQEYEESVATRAYTNYLNDNARLAFGEEVPLEVRMDRIGRWVSSNLILNTVSEEFSKSSLALNDTIYDHTYFDQVRAQDAEAAPEMEKEIKKTIAEMIANAMLTASYGSLESDPLHQIMNQIQADPESRKILAFWAIADSYRASSSLPVRKGAIDFNGHMTKPEILKQWLYAEIQVALNEKRAELLQRIHARNETPQFIAEDLVAQATDRLLLERIQSWSS